MAATTPWSSLPSAPIVSVVSAFLTFSSLWSLASSDEPCAYPCYPPPTGTGGTPVNPTPAIQTPPSQSGSYYPPPAYYSNPPPPAGYIPYYQPPSGGGYYVPPPPDPILPYFPFYFKEPLHGSSSVATLHGPTIVIAMSSTALVFLFTLNVHLR